jgi:hypothetical protein
MKTIALELTDAEYDLIETVRQMYFDESSIELPGDADIDPITMDEYIKRTLIDSALSVIEETEINPDVWFVSAPVKKELCEKYGLSETYQKK